MKPTRREFLVGVGAGALAAGLPRPLRGAAPAVASGHTYDVAVVGAGVFGAWVALALREAGRRVVLVDAYGAGNARASSGGQTRVIRMGYGDKETYSRWSQRSLERWKELYRRTGRPGFFQQTGVLWLARDEDPLSLRTLDTLRKLDVPHERLARAELLKRWPQMDPGPISWAIHEPESGFLVAFHSVQLVADAARHAGADYVIGQVAPPQLTGRRLDALVTAAGERISAALYVFACGPWLGALFPEVVGDRLFVTRQEVFFIGPPPGDGRFAVGAMPVWADFGEEIYGIPDFKGRGFKVAPDHHGPPLDPDAAERIVGAESVARVRDYVGRRFPALRARPVVGSEVCQYTNTSNGDFLIDRHPGADDVWLVGGGSGHGFKHGPALGEYVSARIVEGGTVDPRFALASKEKVQGRTVY